MTIVRYNRMSLNKALQYAVSTLDLDGLKYLSSLYEDFSYIGYLYKDFLGENSEPINELKIIEKARKWQDLEGLKSLYQRDNSNYAEIYTKYFPIITAQEELARSLYDLEGLKLAFNNELNHCNTSFLYTIEMLTLMSMLETCINTDADNMLKYIIGAKSLREDIYKLIENHLTFLHNKILSKENCACAYNYTDTEFTEWLYGSSIELEDLELLIRLEDSEGLKHIIESQNSANEIKAHKDNPALLKYIYHQENLFFAEELLRLGFYFNPAYLLRPNNLLRKKQEYLDHFTKLNKSNAIEESIYNQAVSIINTMYSDPLFRPTSSCNLESAIGQYIYADNIRPDEITEILYTILDSKDIVSDVINYILSVNIYEVPIKIFLTHEIKNSFFAADIIRAPHRNYYVYVNFSERSPSLLTHELSHAFLYSLFDNNAKPYTDNEKTHGLMRFNDYKNFEYKILSQLLNFINPVATPAHTLIEIAEQIRMNVCARVNKLAVQHPEFDMKEDVRAKLAETVEKTSNSPKSGCDLKLEKGSLSDKEFLLNFYNELGWSDDVAYLIYRVSGLLDRTGNMEENIENELLVRLPELLVIIKDENAIMLLQPLIDFWKKHITPEVQNTINMYEKRHCISDSHKPCIKECFAAIEAQVATINDKLIKELAAEEPQYCPNHSFSCDNVIGTHAEVPIWCM